MISAAFDSTLNSRLFRNSSTLYCPQPSLAFLPVPHPLFHFGRFTVSINLLIRISHSPSRRLYEPEAHQVQGDCALSARHQNTAPGPLGPQKFIGAAPKRRRASMPCSIGWVTNLVVISQPLMDSRHRRIKI